MKTNVKQTYSSNYLRTPPPRQPTSSSYSLRPPSAPISSHTPCRHHSHHQSTHLKMQFKPNVKQIPFPLYPSQWQNLLKSKKQQWEELTKDNRQRDHLRFEQKMWAQQQKMKGITFQPNFRGQRGERLPSNVHEKLFKDAWRKREDQIQRQKRVIEQQKRLIVDQQIVGKVPNRVSMLNQEKFDIEPLYKRLQKVVKQQIKLKHRLAQNEESYPFQPTINKKSQQMVNKKDRISNIVERLIVDFKDRQDRAGILREQNNKDLDKSLTFMPTLNYCMPIDQPKTTSKSQTTIDSFTYHPQINPLSEIITKDRKFQTAQEQIYRLHNTPAIKFSQKVNLIETQLYSQCSFNPEINPLSKMMAVSAHKGHTCPLPSPPTYSHRPTLNQNSKAISYVKRAQSMDNIKQKAKEKAQQYLNQVEYNQLKECSFRPQINSLKQSRVAMKSTTLEDISGYSHFQQKVQKTQEKEKIRKQLQEKLFRLEKSYDQRRLKELKRQNRRNESIRY